MTKPPASVRVLAVIGIIWGILGFCTIAWALFSVLGSPNSVAAPLRQDPIFLAALSVTLVVGIPLNFLLIGASESCLRLRPWARKGIIVYAWIAIAEEIASVVFSGIYVLPKLLAAIPAETPPADRARVLGRMAGTMTSSLFGLLFAACLLYFFSQPYIIEAFHVVDPENSTNPLEEPPNLGPPPDATNQ